MVYVVGHRGAAGVEPENTIRGFRYALELGVDYAECDVHLTKDNHLIVMHDETVDRTTNSTGAIRNLTFAEIRSLDAGKGERV
ncbi:TPA: glycerophosphodiester phosphodiesterase, partial [Candidatus Poribacteria bacterium]|nr:glycerophosphodiester phosphodiesterase [Candidatus Poribacteria bacterium]